MERSEVSLLGAGESGSDSSVFAAAAAATSVSVFWDAMAISLATPCHHDLGPKNYSIYNTNSIDSIYNIKKRNGSFGSDMFAESATQVEGRGP